MAIVQSFSDNCISPGLALPPARYASSLATVTFPDKSPECGLHAGASISIAYTYAPGLLGDTGRRLRFFEEHENPARAYPLERAQ